ncbi:unnamed protein product [Cylicostephanus goldi]|uniref:Potassium channel domain-containing protein n=1 Tax=Cylicostephanus goldi TaxID=71465 RepID=A0A3P6Q8P1_CYLGO|nr:unnamed protein product [Cylicostephanus goldi]
MKRRQKSSTSSQGYQTCMEEISLRHVLIALDTGFEVPFDVPLSILMLSRVYLLGRFMVLHSKQFQDASTRTLAALNRIQTVLDQQPILFLTTFTVIFWIVTSWTFVQCERFGQTDQDVPSILYSNALWFIAITFMLNGYGDIVPKTHAGRIIAIFVGVVVSWQESFETSVELNYSSLK